MRCNLKNTLLLLVVVIGFCHLNAQQEDYFMGNRDSIWGFEFDFSELDPDKVKLNELTAKLKKIRAYNDSMMAIVRAENIKMRSDSLEQLYDLVANDTLTDYNAYSFFAGQYHSNVSDLNKSLAAAGWLQLDGMSLGYTNILDFTWKRGRFVNDLFMSVGSGRSVSKNNVSVTYNYTSPVNYALGFAIIDKKRVQFLPYAALNLQTSQLSFANSHLVPFDLGRGAFDTLIKAVEEHRQGARYDFKKRDLMLDAGVELDIHVYYSRRKTGFLIGLRGGKTLPLLSSGWRLQGTKYTEINSVSIRDFHYEVVLRIYARRSSKRSPYDPKSTWWNW